MRGIVPRAGVGWSPPNLAGIWSRPSVPLIAAALLLLATVVRIAPVFGAPGPLGDGGLFYTYSQNLAANGLVPPEISSYQGGIPFPYPPLALEVLAAAGRLGIDPLVFLHWGPPLLAILAVPLVGLLARELLNDEMAALVAMLAYAVFPLDYQYLIVGGGIARAASLDLALTCGIAAVHMFHSGDRRQIVVTGILGGLAQLCHPDGSLASSGAVLAAYLAVGPSRQRTFALGVSGVVGLVVASPWWGPVSASGHLGELLAASGSGWSPLLLALTLDVGLDPWAIPLLQGGLALALADALVRRRRETGAVLVWVAFILVVDVRNAYMDYPVALALAVGAGWAVAIGPLARRLARRGQRLALTGGITAYSLALFALPLLQPTILGPRASVGPSDRSAMAVLARRTQPDEPVAVVTGVPWAFDDLGEWFPALTGRTNMALPQGTEWQAGSTFDRLARLHDAVQECATVICLETVLPAVKVAYVAGPASASARSLMPLGTEDPTASLRTGLRASPDWIVIYDGPAALIAVRRTTSSS
jgi:hypothetical protein